MSWTHLEDATPKARKRYQCYLCERPIEVGQVHVKRTGVHEDGISVTRMHSACEAETRSWDEDDWLCHDASAFRSDVLGLEGGVT